MLPMSKIIATLLPRNGFTNLYVLNQKNNSNSFGSAQAPILLPKTGVPEFSETI